jgi:hypothetical protein
MTFLPNRGDRDALGDQTAAEMLRDPAFAGFCSVEIPEARPTTEPSRKVGDVLRLDEIRLQHRQRMKATGYKDAIGTDNAIAIIGKLPKPSEAVHILTDGSYQGAAVIPAILQLAGTNATEVLIATLSFSKANVDTLVELIDRRQIKRMAVLCSTYFRAGNEDAFGYAVEELGKRKVLVVAARSHMKVTTLAVGRARYVITGSANLRSCLAVEQIIITNDNALHGFYRKAITHIMEIAT